MFAPLQNFRAIAAAETMVLDGNNNGNNNDNATSASEAAARLQVIHSSGIESLIHATI